MITTTANRVKAGAYWCADADKQAQAYLDSAGIGWDDEMPLSTALDGLGLANTLLSLGNPRPRYRSLANETLHKYCSVLFTELELLLEHVDGKPVHLFKERRNYAQANLARGILIRKQWEARKNIAAYPAERLLSESVTILMSNNHLIHIRAIHAGKALAQAAAILTPEEDMVEKLKDSLRIMLYVK